MSSRPPFPHLDQRQRALLGEWIPGADLVEDLSWGLVESAVLHVRSNERDLIVKAGGPNNHHIAREISAHAVITPLIEEGRAAFLRSADAERRIMVLDYLQGSLVDDGEAETDQEILRQAGHVLGMLHGLGSATDESLERNLYRAALKWLKKPHNIPEPQASLARKYLTEHEPGPVTVVPSHGDYSGRNWLAHEGKLRVIDFGRFGYRPAHHDFLRMFFRRWHDHPGQSTSFFEGYGRQAIDFGDYSWWIEVLREAVATAAWSRAVGDETFELLGLRFVDLALNHLDSR